MKPSLFSAIPGFLREVYLEAKRVNWPTRKEVTQNTLLVVGISFATAVFLGTADFLFGLLLQQLAK